MIKPSSLSIVEFNKYISKPELSNDDFKKIFEELNESYFSKSKEIIDKNAERADILDKIRTAQNIYKKKLGLKEVDKDLDTSNDDKLNTVPNNNQDDSDNENDIVKEDLNVKTKNVKKDKKSLLKKTHKNKKNKDSDGESESESEKEPEPESELDDLDEIDNLEKKLEEEINNKTSVKKTTKSKNKLVEINETKAKNPDSEIEQQTKPKKTTKSSKSKHSEPEKKEDHEEIDESEEKTKLKAKTTKKSKTIKK